MTCLELEIPKLSGRLYPRPRDRAAGAACAAHSRTLKQSPRSPTTTASRKTRGAFLIPIASPTPRSSSRPPSCRTERARARSLMITTREGDPVGGCGLTQAMTGRARDRLSGSASILGPGLRHRGGARADRLRFHRTRSEACGRRPRHQSGVAPHPREVRLPVDRRRPATASTRCILRRRSTTSGSTAGCGIR